jgi:cytoskeletal protein RodZ
MTTRQQLKRAVGVDRSDSGRGVAAEPGPTLPERLYAARERKGVDLYRAERDTKIRARYLGALERGDYKELPGAVYTKGFLRNYALYLGLDPEDVLLQWRHERGDPKEVAPAIVVPKPIAAPRQGLTFSPSIVVVALLTVVILVFGAYLGIQILRFTKPPTVVVTQPATAVVDVADATTIKLGEKVRPWRGAAIGFGTTIAGGTSLPSPRSRRHWIRTSSGSSPR